MNSAIVNAILFFYIAAFFTGVVNITLNTISLIRLTNPVQKKLLHLNVIFFIFVMNNFMLFFIRQFTVHEVVHSILLVAFDLTYAALVYSWISYLGASGDSGNKNMTKLAVFAAVFYFVAWLAIDLFLLNNAVQQVVDDYGKLLAAAAEIVIFITFQLGTWFYFVKGTVGKKLNFLICLSMSIYSLWFFIYDMDCIFRFVGPNKWPIYPFDAVIIIYFIFNILIILRHYSQIWNRRKAEENYGGETDIGKVIAKIENHGNLTNREKEILELMIKGENNTQIAEGLIISVYTVKRHVNSIFKKTSIKSRLDLMLLIKDTMDR